MKTISLIIALVLIVGFCLGCQPEVKPGQVWVYAPHQGNPFEEVESTDNLVLDVKGKWIQYRSLNGILQGKTRSCTIRWFLIGSTLKK